MRIDRIVITVAVLTLGACGGKIAPTMKYTVSIDPAFTASQMEAITTAVEDWKTAVPQLSVTYAIGACASPSTEEICIHPAFDQTDVTNDVVGTTRLAPFAGATIWIYVERIRAIRMNAHSLTQQTAEHEFGHAMGLRHSVSGELMAAGIFDQAHWVTTADVAQFWSVRSE